VMVRSLSFMNNEYDGFGSYGNNQIIDAYDRHIDTVYRVCLSLLGNKQDAEDTSQTVFVKLMESKKSFVNTEQEKAWLIVTARNCCRDLQRRWWKKKTIDLDPLTIVSEDEEPLAASALWEKLQQLPASYRLILYLYYFEGYKQIEISTMLGLNLNTVKTRMRNAKKRLKLEFGDGIYE